MFRCPHCSPDCLGMAEHHGSYGCMYCHCMLTEEEALHDAKPPSRKEIYGLGRCLVDR